MPTWAGPDIRRLRRVAVPSSRTIPALRGHAAALVDLDLDSVRRGTRKLAAPTGRSRTAYGLIFTFPLASVPERE